jgi:hypothetical protein
VPTDSRTAIVYSRDGTGEKVVLKDAEVALFLEIGEYVDIGMIEAAKIAVAHGPYRHYRGATVTN